MNREPTNFIELLNIGMQKCILSHLVLGLTGWPNSRGCHSQRWGHQCGVQQIWCHQCCAQKVLTRSVMAGGHSAWCILVALSGLFMQLLFGLILYYKPKIYLHIIKAWPMRLYPISIRKVSIYEEKTYLSPFFIRASCWSTADFWRRILTPPCLFILEA